MAKYSLKVKEYLSKRLVSSPGDHYNGFGEHQSIYKCESNPKRETKSIVKFSIYVENGRIREVYPQAFGDPIVMAGVKWCAEKILKKRLETAEKICKAEKIAEGLDVSWDSSRARGCLTVSVAALAAIEDYRRNQK